ncbi:MAG TPA: ELM1/GtrOC1 family putative glycosyltransferase [Dongiaceae bacterium]
MFKPGDGLDPSKEAVPPTEWGARKSNRSSAAGGPLSSPVPVSTSSIEPIGIVIALLTALAFLVIAIGISAVAHTHFTVPQSGNIPGLRINFWIPPIAAAAGYLLLQCATRYVGPMRPSWRTIAERAVGDYLLLGLFILVIYIHFNIKMWIPVVNPRLYDQDYFAVDQAASSVIVLFDDLRGLLARILPGADLWYQAAFFAVFVLSFVSHALGRRRFHYHNMTALLLIESVGPLTYLIAPAVGPFIYQHGQSALATTAQLRMYGVYESARAGGAAWMQDHGGQFFADPLAAMPSLHVAASFIIAYYAVKARLWVAPVAVFAFCWIFIESVAARWHYLADLPAGMALAIAVIVVTNYLYRRAEAARGDARQPAPTQTRLPQSTAAEASAIGTNAQRRHFQPTVWVLKCHRAGDHAQSLALAQALGWPFVVKETRFHWYELFFALASCATRAGLVRRHTSLLAPPWPDLIILAGRQNETPAKWIRKQSGGRTRIVVIGRYWTPPHELDFVVTTPQFRLPAGPNVLHNSLPLQALSKETLGEAAERCAPRLGGFQRPCVAVLVGGSSGPYVFSRESARRLGREASALARPLGATLLISTSARTTSRAMKALEGAIDVPFRFYRWREHDAENPHLGFLALADRVIVTGDSLSMLAEACATGRPVHVFEFGGGPAAMRGPRSRDRKVRQWWRWSQLKDQGVTGLPYALAIGLPAWRLNRSRDIRLVQDRLVASGRVQWLGDDAPATMRPAALEDLSRAVACIRRLMSVEHRRPAEGTRRNGTAARLPADACAEAMIADTALARRTPSVRRWKRGPT